MKVSKGVVLFVTAMASFLTPFMGSSINIALPTIGREFNAGSSGPARSKTPSKR